MPTSQDINRYFELNDRELVTQAQRWGVRWSLLDPLAGDGGGLDVRHVRSGAWAAVPFNSKAAVSNLAMLMRLTESTPLEAEALELHAEGYTYLEIGGALRIPKRRAGELVRSARDRITRSLALRSALTIMHLRFGR